MDIVQPPTSDYVPASVLVAPGDIIIRGAALPARLGIGTARQILKVNAGATALEYADLQALFSKAMVTKITTVQYIAAVSTAKITYNNILFDTGSIFVDATDRFIPNIPGYYIVRTKIVYTTEAAINYLRLFLYKNGAVYEGARYKQEVATAATLTLELNSLMYFNGTTDYVETFVHNNFAVDLAIEIMTEGTLMHIVGPF